MKHCLLGLWLCLLCGCDVLEDEIYDCIDDDGPVFETRSLPDAYLNEPYQATITIAIENEPFDDSYQYDIEYTATLPPGLSILIQQRRIILSGIPTAAGQYPLSFSVEVSLPEGYSSTNFDGDYDDGDDLCHSYANKSYQLTVFETQ